MDVEIYPDLREISFDLFYFGISARFDTFVANVDRMVNYAITNPFGIFRAKTISTTRAVHQSGQKFLWTTGHGAYQDSNVDKIFQ